MIRCRNLDVCLSVAVWAILTTLVLVELSVIAEQGRIISQLRIELAWWKCENVPEQPSPPTLIEEQ